MTRLRSSAFALRASADKSSLAGQALRLATPAIDTPRPSARVARVAELLDCDESQVRKLVSAGALAAHRVGKRGLRIFLDSVAAYQENGTLETASAVPTRQKRRAATSSAHRAAVADLRRHGIL